MVWNLYICIFNFYTETQTPSYKAFYILHFCESYFTFVIGMICRDIRGGIYTVTSNGINS